MTKFGEAVIKAVVLQPILFLIEIIDRILASRQLPMPLNLDLTDKQRKGPFMKRVDEDPKSEYKSTLLTNNEHLDPNFKNLYDEISNSVTKFSDKPCLGSREKLSTEEEKQPNGKLLKKVIMKDEYDWLSYTQTLNKMDALSNGFLHQGLKSNDNIVLFMETRAEWLLSAFACFRIQVPVVTLYATLGVDALMYGVNQTETKFLVTSGDCVHKLEGILDKIPTVTHIIVVCDNVNSSGYEAFKTLATKHDKKVFKFEEIVEQGKTGEVIDEYKRPEKNDLAIIMYTSGSTGNPKGVMISHLNLYTSLKSLFLRLQKLVPGEDVYIAYLPLAHVLELMSEVAYIVEGIKIGYSSPQTLTDASTSIKKGATGDIRILNPSIMHAVPAVLERLQKAVKAKVAAGSPVKQALFSMAYSQKLKSVKANQVTPILDKILFNKVSEAVVGKNLRFIVAGGALLNAEVQEFVQVCFCRVQQAFGLTETCAGGCTQLAVDYKTNTAGSVIPGVSIRLIDWDEGGYRATDTPHPRGELYIGGDSITLGYYKNKELTDKDYHVINGVRYFATGDIGEMMADGTLKIIDRKKDLVKLSGGEFVSLQKVESVLKLLPFVENCCVVARATMPNCMCIVSPAIPKLLEELGKEAANEAEVARIKGIQDDQEKANAAVKLLNSTPQLIERLNKQAADMCLAKKLSKFEIPTKYMFVSEAWIPDIGLVTDSLKIKRVAIAKFYSEQIDAFYV